MFALHLRSGMKILKGIGIFLLILYTIGCIALYFAQDKLLFNPSPLAEDFVYWNGEEVEVPTSDGITLNSVWIRNNGSKGVILYLHGNRGSNRRCLRQAEMFEGLGYDIFMPDYRGYGKTEGSITSEKQLYSDVQSVYDFLKTKYNESEIAIAGYSLGTGMASHLAAENNPGRLILLAPYVSFIDMKNRRFPIVPNFLIKYPLSNRKHLKKVRCPVILFHGTNDEIIPFDSSVELQKINPSQIQLVKLQGTGHRGTIFHNSLRKVLSTFL